MLFDGFRAPRTAVIMGPGFRRDDRKMSPDLAFILTLALRMAVTAAFLVSASVITERSGPGVGALVATLPISAVPSYVFLARANHAAFLPAAPLPRLPTNALTNFLFP